MIKYYRLLSDLYVPKKRWFLKGLNVVDSNKISVWKFVSPAKVELPNVEQLKIGVRTKGIPLDFTFADFNVPIINERVALLLSEDECQLIPVEVDELGNNLHTYFVSILLKTIDCLDENKSDFEKWMIDDPIRPDKAGGYKAIYKLIIDPAKICGDNMFRLGKSEGIIIVSEKLKNAFEMNRISGVKFEDVSMR